MKTPTFSLGNLAECTPTTIKPSDGEMKTKEKTHNTSNWPFFCPSAFNIIKALTDIDWHIARGLSFSRFFENKTSHVKMCRSKIANVHKDLDQLPNHRPTVRMFYAASRCVLVPQTSKNTLVGSEKCSKMQWLKAKTLDMIRVIYSFGYKEQMLQRYATKSSVNCQKHVFVIFLWTSAFVETLHK